MAEPKVAWIGDDERLDDLLDRLSDAEAVYVDTEFVGDRTYVPRLCLIQVATPDVVACIDPLAEIDLDPFWDLLADPDVVKVLHAADNDFALFVGPCDGVPAPLFDTQVAAAFCGHGAQIGYANLVQALCGETLDKSMQRTDWARRPLSQAAVRYAAGDVTWLRDVHTALVDELEARGRTGWAAEEFERRCERSRFADDPALAWRRVRGRDRLDPASLAVLAEIASWRESVAKSSNRPRRWVLSDEVCLAAAQQRPEDADAVRALRGFDPRRHGSHVTPLVQIVRAASRLPESRWPVLDRPIDGRESSAVEAMQTAVRAAADEVGLPPELIATTDDLLRVARGDRDVALFSGWRSEVLGDRLERFRADRR